MPTAINRKTGSPIKGTLERVMGVAVCSSINREPNGNLSFQYGGGTDIDWNGQKTVVDSAGRPMLVDEDGETCSVDDVDFTND